MAYSENPFTPAFGEVPVHLAGRKQTLATLDRAFRSERRRPELTTLFSGARGTGKTTMLSIASRKAASYGWIVASTTAMSGMLEDIEIQTVQNSSHLLASQSSFKVKEIGIPQLFDVKVEHKEVQLTNWRSRIGKILDELTTTDTGLLITVDEVKPNLDEMIQLSAYYQHFIREERKVALLMAGLPQQISSLLNSDTVSFLRRAQQVKLGRLDNYEIKAAMLKTITDEQRTIDDDALNYAVDAIGGFPFLLQLVGYYAWDADIQKERIDKEMVRHAITLAQEELSSRMFDATYKELSNGDLAFLKAMLMDAGDSSIADIQKRLRKSSSQVSQYRRRLIEAGIIGERRRGVIGFDLPFFKDYLAQKEW